MPITIYPEEGEVLNRPPQPSVFDCGNPLTVAEKICNVDKDSVKSVNGIEPDSNGNVEIETGGGGEGTVKSVNGVQPDDEGNVTVDAQSIGVTGGGNVQGKINDIEQELGGVVKTVNGVEPDDQGNVNVGGTATVTVDVGGTVTGEPGSEASVTNSGTQQNVVLNFTIPRGATGAQGPKGEAGADGAPGEQGPQGPAGQDGADGEPGPAGADGAAATIQVGTVTAGAPGSSPQVTNVGTENAAVFNFVLPRGEAGPQGEPGPAGADGQDGQQGPQGEPGPAGADGEPGAAATITVGSTTTGAAGTQASVTNSGTEYAAVLNFTIPRGEKGEQGPQGPAGESGVTALYKLDSAIQAVYHGAYRAVVNFSSALAVGDIVTVLLTREGGNITANTFPYSYRRDLILMCAPNNNTGATIFNNASIAPNSITFGDWYSGYEFTGTLGQNLCTYVQVYRQRYSLTQTDALTSAEGVRF